MKTIRIMHQIKVEIHVNTLEKKRTKPLSYLPPPPFGQDMTQGHFLSGV